MLTHAHARQQSERLLKLYAALLKCGQAVICGRDPDLLFEDICRHMVTLGGLRAAWVGTVQSPGGPLSPRAHFGDGLAYLQTIHLSQLATGLTPPGDLVGMALAQNQCVWSQDLAADPGLHALQPLAQTLGWHAGAALPLHTGGALVGVLSIYACQTHAFDPLTRELLAQLASNISYALDVFENDAQRRQVEYALQESEVRYSALFANSCMPMVILDPASGAIVDANILALDFYGWDKATFTRMNIMDVNTLSPEQIRQEMALAARSQRSYFEFQHRLANGELRDVEVFSRPVTFDQRAYLMSAIHDVSERKLLQTQMRSAQTLTQRFIDHLPGSAFVKDSHLRLMLVNQPLANLLGAEPQSLIGKTAHDLFGPDFADTLSDMDREVLASGQSKTYEESYNGRHSEASLFVMDDDTGQRFLGGITLDVTDRFRDNQRTRAMLRLNQLDGSLSEKQFLSEGLESAQALTNSQIGFLHFVNPDQETLELVTWTAGALQGCTATFDAHYPVSQAGLWADCLRQRQPTVYNDYAALPDKHGLPEGHTPLTRLISVPIIEGARACLLMGVGNKASDYDQHDVETLLLMGNAIWRIVSRARAEKALQQQVQELVALNRDLAATQLQLLQSEKMASIGQLAAGVAHEINNPIGFVKSNLGSLADYVDKLLAVARAYAQLEAQLQLPGAAAATATLGNADCAHALAAVQRSKQEADFEFLLSDLPALIQESREGVERVGKIVMDLKNFSRVGETEFEWTDLHAGLESTINVVWNELKYKADVVRAYGELPPVFCVASQINQVLMNLLVNAAQAITRHGRITVRTGTQGDSAWIEVQDTGCGITAQSQACIFDPFYTTKPLGEGTGLGLSIAMGIVKQHHGSLTVTSEVGQGSTFRVTLPIDGGRGAVLPGLAPA